MNAIAGKFYLRVASAATSSFAESTSMFLVILVHVLLGNYLEASVVYSVAQYFGMIKTMMTVFYPRAMASMAEARVSVERIQVIENSKNTQKHASIAKQFHCRNYCYWTRRKPNHGCRKLTSQKLL